MATKDRILSAAQRQTIANNIFWAAHPALEPWESFHWHPPSTGGASDTYKEHSSQALAIDVFGTIKMSAARDAILAAVARQLDLPTGGPWTVDLEWSDAQNYLKERQPTWVDAVAQSPQALIFFECKFTEFDGGGCSQRLPIRTGSRRGVVQCNGSYAPQLNPANQLEAYCALSAKGIRYWDIIPAIFGLRNDLDHSPCPFAGPWFQWMRNLTVCYEAARQTGRQAAFVVAYADGPTLPMAARVKSADWARFRRTLRPGVITLRAMSTQSIVALAQAAAPEDAVMAELVAWVTNKIDGVCRARQVEMF